MFWRLYDRDMRKVWHIPKSQYRSAAVHYPLTGKGKCMQCDESFMGSMTSHKRGKVRYVTYWI
jgi:hypothetical protein